MRIGVLISGGGSTLANLIDCTRDGRLRGVEIVRVVSSRRAVRGVEIARDAGLPTEVVRRRDFSGDAAFSERINETLSAARPDLIVMGGFLCYWCVPPCYAQRAINIHPSLLPAFGGQGMFGERVHAAVLRAGGRESGCTVHIVDEQYDHGPIVAQARVAVLPGDTPASLAARVGDAERALYPQVIQSAADHGVAWLADEAQRFASAPRRAV